MSTLRRTGAASHPGRPTLALCDDRLPHFDEGAEDRVVANSITARVPMGAYLDGAGFRKLDCFDVFAPQPEHIQTTRAQQ